ncbi:MAG: hypothetical protein LBC18_07565 [Opitutaceae bacterium]|nr:hypothetical protein [Opitutaceae bacterium]
MKTGERKEMMKTKPTPPTLPEPLLPLAPPPTPSELVSFARAISGPNATHVWEDKSPAYWNEDELHNAVFHWLLWKRNISIAYNKICSRLAELDAREANQELITIDEAMRRLGTRHVKTFKKWFVEASIWNFFPPAKPANNEDLGIRAMKVEEEWTGLKKRGTIGTNRVEIMREVRDSIASTRGRKAGKAKAARKI